MDSGSSNGVEPSGRSMRAGSEGYNEYTGFITIKKSDRVMIPPFCKKITII